jgi:hypothetical protein
MFDAFSGTLHHSQTQKAFWTATMDMKTPPETLTFAQHVLRLPMI